MKTKKLLSLLLATIMSVGMLVSCAPANDAENPSSGTKEDTSQSSGDTTDETIKTTLTVWGPAEDQSEEQGKWLQTMCEQFNTENPQWDITFKYGVASEADVDTILVQDVENSADVFMYSNDKVETLVSVNGISRIGGDTEKYVKESNSQAVVDSVTIDDAIYGIPFTTNTWFMYYDKSAFTEEEAGNLDKMLAKNKVSFPLTDSWYISSFYVANGATLFGDGTDNEAGIDFGGANSVDTTKYLVDLVNNPNFSNDADGSGIAGIREGSIKAMFSGSWNYNALKEVLGDNLGIAALPTITINGEDKQMMSFAGSKALGVNPNTEYPQISVALAKYLAANSS